MRKRKNLKYILAVLLLLLIPWAMSAINQAANEGNVVEYQGKIYSEKKNVTNILLLGSDERDTIENDLGVIGGNGQADYICLISIDHDAKTVRMLSIPRETMVDVDHYDEEDNLTETCWEQLCLQYAYGTSSSRGCELMAEKVSELLDGTTIDYYFAISLGAVHGIIDEVGGVDITMSQDWPMEVRQFVQGETVHMTGQEAEDFIHFRDVDRYYTNVERMGRQRDFLQAFVPKMKEALKNNSKLPFTLLEKYAGYVTYNIPMTRIPGLVKAATEYTIDWDGSVQLPGEETHLGKYDSRIVDEDATRELVLSWFYDEQTE
jgi:LCP family protein required for cell wall assembly